jgi:uncharacterized membrane protein YhaH (DUF805 family)
MDASVSFFKLNLYDLAVECYRLLGGRTSRRDFWMYILAQILLNMAVAVIAALLGLIPGLGVVLTVILLSALYAINLLLAFPNLVLAVRRLHDADMSGWFVLLCAILVGYILLAFGGTPGPNRYGPQPAGSAPPAPPLGYGQQPSQAYGAPQPYAAPPQGYAPPSDPGYSQQLQAPDDPAPGEQDPDPGAQDPVSLAKGGKETPEGWETPS